MAIEPNRLSHCFAALHAQNRPALVTFLMGGDPDLARSRELLCALPGQGADIVELGMPFSDPAADGPSIQAAGNRALAAGSTLKHILELARAFRAQHAETPLILMGYVNPVFHYGIEAFARDAAAAGVDGVILVDLPPEEEAEFMPHFRAHGIARIRLVTPVTDDTRLAQILPDAEGFVYYIAVAGITGTKGATAEAIAAGVARVKRHTTLPVVAGFGIRTPEQAATLAPHLDGIVVGSALVERASKGEDVGELVRRLRGAL
jgi:tryptophan synthase alpha chain